MLEKDLIEIYREASKFFYNNTKNINQKSAHWTRYNFKEFTPENLINFRKKKNLSDGLDDQTDNFSFKIYSEIVEQTTEPFIIKNLSSKNVGNSDIIFPYKDKYMDYNKLIHIYWFWLLENKVLKNIKINNICEIGGGFGSFSEIFISNYNSKIFLIDLPEANLMSAYYLKKFFPEKKFFLFNDYKEKNFLSKIEFEKNNIIILPPNCNIDEEIEIDFFINTRSMQEMNHQTIKSYFDFIHKRLKVGGYFLNVNRYEKSSVGYPIRFSEFPYDNYWKSIISEPSFNQNWTHFLLAERTISKNEENFSRDLNNIKVIGKKFYGLHNQDNYKPGLVRYKILRIILKNIPYSNKFLNFCGKFLLKIGKKLENFK